MRYILLILVLLLSSNFIFAQTTDIDIQLIKQKQDTNYHIASYYSGAMNSQELMKLKKGTIARTNPILFVPVGAMWLYQNIISPQLARECPYEITCSNFSKYAIKENGFMKGILISTDRLMRCNPFSLADINEDNVNPSTQKIIDFPCWYK